VLLLLPYWLRAAAATSPFSCWSASAAATTLAAGCRLLLLQL